MTSASVTVDGEVVGQIGRGLLALVGITEGDDDTAADWCCRRLLGTRLWEDNTGKAWAKSVQSDGLELLLVSQFTLYGVLKGRTRTLSELAWALHHANALLVCAQHARVMRARRLQKLAKGMHAMAPPK